MANALNLSAVVIRGLRPQAPSRNQVKVHTRSKSARSIRLSRIIVSASDGDEDIDGLRKTQGFGRGKALSSETQRVSLSSRVEGKVEIKQAAWADGGGLSGAWKIFMEEHRNLFNEQLVKDAEGKADVLEWCMQVAAEDDALSTHSVVQLPVQAYTKRVDNLVNEFVAMGLADQAMTGDSDEEKAMSVARAVENFLFETKKYKVATKQMVVDMEVYSPYRVYMHNVLPQVCGSPAVISAILTAVLERLAARGFLPADVKVVLPMMGGAEGLPFAQLAGEEQVPGIVHASPRYIVKDCLRNLKKAYWPWEWYPGSPSGFVTAAKAALGEDGRFGRKVGGTFVPPKGRPFGDIARAMNASERLVLLDQDPVEQRDLGVLLYHEGRFQDAYQTLSAYEISSSSKLDSGSMPITILQEGALVETVEERELLDRLMLDLQVKLAESSFAAPDAEK